MTPTYNDFSASVRTAMGRAFNAKMENVRLHGQIALEMCQARGIGRITDAEVRNEILTRRIAAAVADLNAPPRRPGDPRPFTDDERDRRIQKAMADLTAPRPRPAAGIPVREALLLGDSLGRAERNPARWQTCIHESGHACVAEDLKPGCVFDACVRTDNSGYVTHDKLGAWNDAIVCCAGADAEHFILGVPGVMQTHRPETDGQRFVAELAAHFGAETMTPDDKRTHQVAHASAWTVNQNFTAIIGLARLLFDHGTLDGQTIRTVTDFYRGAFDEMLYVDRVSGRMAGLHRGRR